MAIYKTNNKTYFSKHSNINIGDDEGEINFEISAPKG